MPTCASNRPRSRSQKDISLLSIIILINLKKTSHTRYSLTPTSLPPTLSRIPLSISYSLAGVSAAPLADRVGEVLRVCERQVVQRLGLGEVAARLEAQRRPAQGRDVAVVEHCGKTVMVRVRMMMMMIWVVRHC